MRNRVRLWCALAIAAVTVACVGVAAPAAAVTPPTIPVVNVARTDVPVGADPTSAAFTTNGAQLYVANAAAGTVSVIDVRTARVTATIPVAPNPVQVLASPDGTSMLVSSSGVPVTSGGTTVTDGGVSVIDVVTHQTKWIDVGEQVWGIGLRPRTSELWIGLNRGAVKVVNLASGATAEIGMSSPTTRFTFSPDGSMVYMVTLDGLQAGFGQYDVYTRQTSYWGEGFDCDQIVFSPDGATRYEVSGGQGIYDTVDHTQMTNNARAIVFRRDGSQLFALSRNTSEVTIYDPLRREATGSFAIGAGGQDIQISPDGNTLITVNGTDNTVSIVSLPAQVAPAGLAVDRISGADRFEVSAAISRRGFPTGAPVAYVASGYGFPDALSAAPAAAAKGGPVLLTMPGDLPDAIRTELIRLHPAKIVLVGGPAAISDSVLAQLSSIASSVRVWGADRYATSKAVVDDAFGTTTEMFIASGENFPDALSAGAAAAKAGAPVLLIPGHGDFPEFTPVPDVADTLSRHAVTSVQFVGGPAAIADSVATSATFLPYNAHRLAGADRYATSIALSASAFDVAPQVYIASGTGFPDALGGSALAAATSSPLYVVPPNCLTTPFIMELQHLGAARLTLIGGPAALSTSVEQLRVCGY